MKLWGDLISKRPMLRSIVIVVRVWGEVWGVFAAGFEGETDEEDYRL
jgi:hypothetical protein